MGCCLDQLEPAATAPRHISVDMLVLLEALLLEAACFPPNEGCVIIAICI